MRGFSTALDSHPTRFMGRLEFSLATAPLFSLLAPKASFRECRSDAWNWADAAYYQQHKVLHSMTLFRGLSGVVPWAALVMRLDVLHDSSDHSRSFDDRHLAICQRTLIAGERE